MDKENLDKIVSFLEEYNAPPEMVDEVVGAIKSSTRVANAPAVDAGAFEVYIRTQIAKEPDWRARAALAASLISKRLETGY